MSRLLAASLLTLPLAVGCALPGGAGGLTGGDGPAAGTPRVASADDPVVQVAAFWRAAEGVGPAGTPVRGFAGRILLITAGGNDPVACDGTARVYLFSDDGEREERAVPVNQIDLPPAAWRGRLSVSNLGPAYDVFIPYTKPAAHAVRCSLRVRFTPLLPGGEGEDGEPTAPVAGRPLFSHAASCTLDGPPDPDRHAVAATTERRVETIRAPDFRIVRADDRAAEESPERGVVPASAAEPAPDSVGEPAISDRLSPESRRRIEQALAKYRERRAAGEVPPDFSGNRSRFAERAVNATRRSAGGPAAAPNGRGARPTFAPPPGRPGGEPLSLHPPKPAGNRALKATDLSRAIREAREGGDPAGDGGG